MYFAISKISFELDTKTAMDRRELKSLSEKIRARFRVSVLVSDAPEDSGEASLVIAALANTEKRLTTQLDSISSFCEESGFGRIDQETTLMDHISSIDED